VERAGLILALLLTVAACQRPEHTLTFAAALLPSELPAYREVVRDFEERSGWRVVVVPQQYADIRRALAAEAAAGSGTLDLVELDVYSLAAARDDVIALDEIALQPELAVLQPEAVQIGRFDGIRFLPHRITWQALLYDHDALGEPPRTWDELLAVARAHRGQIGIKGARYEGLTCDVLPFVWAAGGRADAFDDAGARAAFELFAALAPTLHPHSATFREASGRSDGARGVVAAQFRSRCRYRGAGPGAAALRSRRRMDRRARRRCWGRLHAARAARRTIPALALARFLLSREAQRQLHQLGWSCTGDVATNDSGELLDGFAQCASAGASRHRRVSAASRLWRTRSAASRSTRRAVCCSRRGGAPPRRVAIGSDTMSQR
jgi:hypothetical protein